MSTFASNSKSSIAFSIPFPSPWWAKLLLYHGACTTPINQGVLDLLTFAKSFCIIQKTTLLWSRLDLWNLGIKHCPTWLHFSSDSGSAVMQEIQICALFYAFWDLLVAIYTGLKFWNSLHMIPAWGSEHLQPRMSKIGCCQNRSTRMAFSISRCMLWSLRCLWMIQSHDFPEWPSKACYLQGAIRAGHRYPIAAAPHRRMIDLRVRSTCHKGSLEYGRV